MYFRSFKWPRGGLLLSLIFLGGLGLVGATLSFYLAITMAPVNLVIVIAYMYPAIVSLLSVIFLKQPMTVYKIIALFLTSTGIVLAIGMDSGGQPSGIILAVTILGETVTLRKIMGACMVLSAVFILAQKEYQTAQTQMH